MPLREMGREQIWMLPPTLDELLPLDHPARFVAEFVDALGRDGWSELGVEIGGDPLGAPAYHPRALLSVWLYGYIVFREYVDEAESGRIADRPEFRKMIDAATKPSAPFREILVWKFSRFTRKREHAVAFKSMLRRKGIRVVSITEHADDSPTGKLMEAIIESVDEFYSENLAQDVVRGMREAASRGFFLASKAPFGYKRVKVSDGVKERPTLEVDPATAPVVKEMFESSLSGNGLKEICKVLNDRGITNRGKRWYKGGLHYLLNNEAYTGTAVWGRTSKGEKAQDPVRVEGAWPALVSRELFDDVQQAMRDRAPKVQRPARVGSRFLLSGLLKCGVCGRPYSGQGAKSGQFAYYICGTLFREGAGTCSARYLNAPRVEDFVVEKVLDFVKSGGPKWTVGGTVFKMWLGTL